MTDHRQHTFLRSAAVNVAIAPFHGPESRAQIRPCAINERLAKSCAPRLIADERSKDIFSWNECCSERGTDGFLSLAEIHATDDFPCLVEARKLIFQQAGLHHRPIHRPNIIGPGSLVCDPLNFPHAERLDKKTQKAKAKNDFLKVRFTKGPSHPRYQQLLHFFHILIAVFPAYHTLSGWTPLWNKHYLAASAK